MVVSQSGSLHCDFVQFSYFSVTFTCLLATDASFTDLVDVVIVSIQASGDRINPGVNELLSRQPTVLTPVLYLGSIWFNYRMLSGTTSLTILEILHPS